MLMPLDSRGVDQGDSIHPSNRRYRTVQPKGKYAGEYEERISSIKTSETRVGIPNKRTRTIYFQTKFIMKILILMVMTINLLQMDSFFKNKIKNIIECLKINRKNIVKN